MVNSIEGPARGRGKWGDPSVPKRGWVCDGEEDLGSPMVTCEMCEEQEIRYVHYMTHTRYPEALACGCVCAGHMEGNEDAARLRERGMKSRAKRRSAWPDRKDWHQSQKGNWTIKKDGYQMTVFGEPGRYRVSVSKPLGGGTTFGKRRYDSLRDAQFGTFDAFQWALRDGTGDGGAARTT